jgi:hypothetical protein
MLFKIKTKIKCYLCDCEKKKFNQCKCCSKIVCNDCFSTVFVSSKNICFFCIINQKKNNIFD